MSNKLENMLRENMRRFRTKNLDEATFVKGRYGTEVIVDDFEIAENSMKYLGQRSDDVIDSWLSLFSDDISFSKKISDDRYIETANEFLSQINAPTRCIEKISQNEDGEITWRMILLQ